MQKIILLMCLIATSVLAQTAEEIIRKAEDAVKGAVNRRVEFRRIRE